MERGDTMGVDKDKKLPKEVEEYLHLKFLGATVCEMCGRERYAITMLKGPAIIVCELCFYEIVKEEIESTQEYIDQQKEYEERLKKAKEFDAIERFFDSLPSRRHDDNEKEKDT